MKIISKRIFRFVLFRNSWWKPLEEMRILTYSFLVFIMSRTRYNGFCT